jgi:hypothetical protein
MNQIIQLSKDNLRQLNFQRKIRKICSHDDEKRDRGHAEKALACFEPPCNRLIMN